MARALQGLHTLSGQLYLLCTVASAILSMHSGLRSALTGHSSQITVGELDPLTRILFGLLHAHGRGTLDRVLYGYALI
jgi:hypothetical protein